MWPKKVQIFSAQNLLAGDILMREEIGEFILLRQVNEVGMDMRKVLTNQLLPLQDH